MTPAENKKLVLDHYDALYRQDAEAVRKQLAADFVDHEAPLGSTPPGPEAVLRAFDAVHQAFPDLSVKIEDIVAEGDLVAVRAVLPRLKRLDAGSLLALAPRVERAVARLTKTASRQAVEDLTRDLAAAAWAPGPGYPRAKVEQMCAVDGMYEAFPSVPEVRVVVDEVLEVELVFRLLLEDDTDPPLIKALTNEAASSAVA